MPHVSISWLSEHVDVAEGTTLSDVAAALVRVGLEEESIDTSSAIIGPLVVGRILERVPEEQKNGKVINWCRVDVGPEHNDLEGGRGIVCGAHNFDVGDSVVVALPGAALPGDFVIAARKTYGHISDGMICSSAELGLVGDAEGIIVLNDPPVPGTDAIELLQLGEPTLEINVTPDRGYCFSMRGIAREYGLATSATFADPARVPAPADSGLTAVRLTDSAPIHGQAGCDRFVVRRVEGFDPHASTPQWIQTRLQQAGVRPISLAVDVTNYVMLDLGQPLHAYDAATIHEPIVVRRAASGEVLTTLDGVKRSLDAEDLLITDSPAGDGSRVLGLAGVMGGAETEVTGSTTDLLIEAAHFDPISVARSARRHRLPTEAAKRFERGVDTELQAVAAQRVVDLLIAHGGGRVVEGATDINRTSPPPGIPLDPQRVSRLVGVEYTREQVISTLEAIGSQVRPGDGQILEVTPASWRSDLNADVDLIEEVARIQGYDQIPSIIPVRINGGGLTLAQRVQRRIGLFLQDRGIDEVLTYPFISTDRHDELDYEADDPRRVTLRLVNPMPADTPLLRTGVLDTLVGALQRNVSRGNTDVAIYETSLVLTGGYEPHDSPLPSPGELPNPSVLEAVHAAVPTQRRHLAGLLSGRVGLPGPLNEARRYDYADAVEIVTQLGELVGVELTRRQGKVAPFHPGRVAEFFVSGEGEDRSVGFAGELAPQVCRTLGLPERTSGWEIDLETILELVGDEPRQYGRLSVFPVAKEDIAVVVPQSVPAAEVLALVRGAAGPLAETVSLFDVYEGQGVAEGWKSLAFALKLRATDRTLTGTETAEVRDRVIAAISERWGGYLRT